MMRLAFHGSVLIHHLFAGIFALNWIDFSTAVHATVINMERYRWRFLTNWNFNLQTAYFLLCVIEDLIEKSNKFPAGMKRLRAFKSSVFTVFVFPYSVFVSIMFWSMYAINRELVFPTAAEEVLPSWLNHAIHTNITVVIMLEMLMSYHWYHKRKVAIIGVNVFMVVYSVCLLYTYLIDGDWIYPIFHHMDWSQRVLFYVVNHVIIMAFYMVGETIHSVIWGEKIRKRIKDKREKLLLIEKLD